MAIFHAYIFILGLILGSFLSVIVSRLDQKRGIFLGRSECPDCLTKLKWYDLFPVFSFLFLRGKCHYCGRHISWLYPIMEFTVAGSFLSYCAISSQCFSLAGFYWLFVIFILLALLFFDYVHYILPDKLILIALVAVLIYNLVFNSHLIINGLLTGLALGGFFGIIFVVSRGEWIGFGDVKLAFLVGFILGYPAAIFAITVATWSGALWGLGMIATGKANLKTQLPFGTFICGSAIIFIIFNEIISNYVQYIF